MVCNFDNSSNENISLGNNLTFNTFSAPYSDKFVNSSTVYSESLSATFQICKKMCNVDYNTLELSEDEISTLLRWLGRKEYHKFKTIGSSVHFNGSFNEFQEIKIGGKTFGIELTFVTDSPYGYCDLVTEDFLLNYNLFNRINGLEQLVSYNSKFPLYLQGESINFNSNSYTTYASGYYSLSLDYACVTDEDLKDVDIILQLIQNDKIIYSIDYSKYSSGYFEIEKGVYKTQLVIEVKNEKNRYYFWDFSLILSEAIINNISDEIGFLYPNLFRFKSLGTGDLIVKNSFNEDRYTEIKNIINNESIEMNGENKIISTTNIPHSSTLYKDFNFNFFRLYNSYDNRINIITVNLPGTVTIQYYPIKKVGVV